MGAGSVIWFLVVAMWLPDGQHKVIGGGQFANEMECRRMRDADREAKKDLPAIKIECMAGPARPKGLPDVQPHVPQRVGGGLI